MCGALWVGARRAGEALAHTVTHTEPLSAICMCVCVAALVLSFIFSIIIKIIKRRDTHMYGSFNRIACMQTTRMWPASTIGIADVCPLRVDVPQSRSDAGTTQYHAT